MTDLEKIIDMWPKLRFYFIDVESNHYNGHIEGDVVYINRLHPDLQQIKTAIHEGVHADTDVGDLSDRRQMKTMLAEKFAEQQAKRIMHELGY